jgi:hypothetical protein
MGYHAGLCFTITVVYCWTTVVVWRTYTSLEKTVLDEVAEHRELVMRRRQAFSRDLQRRLEHRRKSVRRARLDALRKVQLARHRIEVERRDAVFRAERFERTQAREMAKRQARQAERIARRQMMEMLRAAPGTESGRRLEIINQLKVGFLPRGFDFETRPITWWSTALIIGMQLIRVQL